MSADRRPGLGGLTKAILDWIPIRRPASIHHRALGVVEYKGGSQWCGTPPGSVVAVVLWASRRGPRPDVLAAAVQSIQDLATLEPRARQYLAAIESKEGPWPSLTLNAVHVGTPSRNWVPQERAKAPPGSAQPRPDDGPYVALEFGIEGDRNVVDVVFAAGVPVDWDYH